MFPLALASPVHSSYSMMECSPLHLVWGYIDFRFPMPIISWNTHQNVQLPKIWRHVLWHFKQFSVFIFHFAFYQSVFIGHLAFTREALLIPKTFSCAYQEERYDNMWFCVRQCEGFKEVIRGQKCDKWKRNGPQLVDQLIYDKFLFSNNALIFLFFHHPFKDNK